MPRPLAGILLVAALGCQPLGAPNESFTQTVEGCHDAVARLRACCPAWDMYLSCTYLTNATAVPDLSPGQSRCIAKKSCEQIAQAIQGEKYLCGRTFATRQCR